MHVGHLSKGLLALLGTFTAPAHGGHFQASASMSLRWERTVGAAAAPATLVLGSGQAAAAQLPPKLATTGG